MATQATVVTEILKELQQLREPLGITTTKTTDAAGNILFSISLDLNNFYNNFLEKNLSSIQSVFKQLDPVIKLLTTEIPILSDIPQAVNAKIGNLSLDQDSDHSSISVLDLIAFAGKYSGNPVNIGVIDDISKITQFLNQIHSDGDIDLGQFKITPQGVFDPLPLSKDIPNPHIPVSGLPNTFSSPLLDNPRDTVFAILQSDKPLDLFTYTPPELELNSDLPPIDVPIVGPLGITADLGFSVGIKTGFGFDTFALENGGSFSDGFFIIPDTQTRLSGDITVGPAITISVATIASTLTVTPGLTFNLNDPKKDGLRLSEINGFDHIFERPDLSIGASLAGEVRVLGVNLTEDLRFNLPKLELGEFPPPEVDKLIGYIKQSLSLNDGLVAAILNEAGDLIRGVGKAVRETFNSAGDFIREEFKDGVRIAKEIFNSAGDFTREQFNDLGRTTRRITKLAGSAAQEVTDELFDAAGKVLSTNIFRAGEFFAIRNAEGLFNAGGALINDGGEILKSAAQVLKERKERLAQGDLSALNPFALTDGGTPSQPSIPNRPSSPIFRDPLTGAISVQTGAGADVLEGTDAGDDIRAGAGDDFVSGNGGRDFLYGEGGNDVLKGGTGNDTLEGGTGNDKLFSEDGNDLLKGDAGDDELRGGAGIDQLYGGTDNDTLNGDAGNDKLFGEAGNDLLKGDAGDDELRGGDDTDTLYGGIDNDTLNGDEGNDKLFGETGNDLLKGDAGDDELRGGDDTDTLYGGIDNDTLNGDEGNDKLFGEDGNDILKGDAGNDELEGGDNSDRLYGGIDNDRLYGGAGNDNLFGESGSDILNGNAGDDELVGGAEADSLYGLLFHLCDACIC
ncbi:calcium-binding protein [Nostoc sp. JL34]|uniref:calcium-binding protein n=1 Tax=Nostoc sp. JL34 TaxID=2815397 RepID=UPI0025CC9C44|nr:hypothetical protein [Nostoc sp. JL34]